MNIRDTKDALEYLFKAQVTPFFWGDAGIGKSSVPKQYAQERGWLFFPFYLGAMSDNGDILGLAEFVKSANGGVSTNFAMPKWLADAIYYCNDNPTSGAIIFLDEFNRAPRSLMSGMFSFALDKTFHTIKLPVNCHVIAAGNPPTDEYYVTDVNDRALMARFCHIKLEPTFDEWVVYAKETGVDPTLISFFKEQPELLEDKASEFSLKSVVKMGRRNVTLLDNLRKTGMPSNLYEQAMHGIIGVERTVAYLQHLKNQDKPLTAKEVLEGSKFDLVKKWSNPEDVRASNINLTRDNLKEEFAKRDESGNLQPMPGEKENLIAFLTMIPKDIAYSFCVEVAEPRKGAKSYWEMIRIGEDCDPRIIELIKAIRMVVK
jgi:hypothetical protein